MIPLTWKLLLEWIEIWHHVPRRNVVTTINSSHANAIPGAFARTIRPTFSVVSLGESKTTRLCVEETHVKSWQHFASFCDHRFNYANRHRFAPKTANQKLRAKNCEPKTANQKLLKWCENSCMESDELTSDDTSSDGPQELECHCDVTCFASTLPLLISRHQVKRYQYKSNSYNVNYKVLKTTW